MFSRGKALHFFLTMYGDECILKKLDFKTLQAIMLTVISGECQEAQKNILARPPHPLIKEEMNKTG